MDNSQLALQFIYNVVPSRTRDDLHKNTFVGRCLPRQSNKLKPTCRASLRSGRPT